MDVRSPAPRHRPTRRAPIASPRREGWSGQALVEYALMLLFIAIASVVFVTAFGVQVQSLYQSITSKMP